MQKKRRPGFGVLTATAFMVSIVLLAVGCGTYFSSNGQRIFFTATSASGQLITYYGGPGTMMGGRLACVNCHGPQGHGGRVNIMMYSFDAPNITWPDLTAKDMDHPPYTEETLKRAITQGLDPAGDSLVYPMPRWRMSTQDIDDLVAFIKTLK